MKYIHHGVPGSRFGKVEATQFNIMQTIGSVMLTLPMLLPFVSAQLGNVNYQAFGANSSAPADGYATFRAADRTPNETHQVTFNRDNTITSGKNWTWTLKISDVLMPNYTGTDLDSLRPSDPQNAHVAFTTYDFAWPEGGNLNQAVGKGENLNSAVATLNPSCMYMIYAQWPSNVSEKYDPSSSDCTSALGDDCVNAILTGLHGEAGCETQNFPTNSQFIDQCDDSFGALLGAGGGWAVQAWRESYLLLFARRVEGPNANGSLF